MPCPPSLSETLISDKVDLACLVKARNITHGPTFFSIRGIRFALL